jgi:hypothetical protein
MLSQTAWKLGRAFTKGKKGVPAEFSEVEREADRLSEALRVVAETLNSNASLLLDKAEDVTALSSVLDSAQRTLEDLESFIARYRIVKPETGERSWSDLVLTNYKTIMWTTEGGDISALRDMLHVHTNNINLTMQALQPQPRMMNGTPALTRQSLQASLNSNTSDVQIGALGSTGTSARRVEATKSRTSSCYSDSDMSEKSQFTQQWRQNSLHHENVSWRPENGYAKNGVVDWDFETGLPPTDEMSIGDRYTRKPATTPIMSSSSSLNSPAGQPPRHRLPSIPRRESTTLPGLISDDAEERSSRKASSTRMSPIPHGGNRRIDSKGFEPPFSPPPLPPKALGRSYTYQPATPTSLFSGTTSAPTRHASHSSGHASRRTTASNYSTHASIRSSVVSSPHLGPERTEMTSAQAFEKSLYRNAAILCDDVRVNLVEFAQHNPDEPDPRFDTEMVPVCKEGRVCVIRKRENLQGFDNGGTRTVTSIWMFSDDGEVRCQHKLPELTETVPYCSFFDKEKVAVPPANGDEITLRLHAPQWGAREEKDIKTKWVNYVFESEDHANRFQSAIFGRQLLGSFRTNKTTVIHEGFKGAFAFEEQFSNIEVLRLWQDDGVNTPGGAGGVMALLHMSGNFGQGYAKWWINSSRQQVRVKDEHNKFAKMKGIDIRVLRIAEKRSNVNGVRSTSDTSSSLSGESKGKKGPERNVTGIRIEFKTDEERARFVDTVKRVQENMLPLPDI